MMQTPSASKPSPKAAPTILPIGVQPLDFAAARLSELRELEKAVRSYNGTRRTFQMLPRHLRRRTMSHKLYRVPKRVRAAAEREMLEKEKPSKKPHRKHKRRPLYLLRDYIRRQREFVWLETHLWHAKRMKMQNLWGHKLADHPRDKSLRACYRAAFYESALYDSSHQHAIELRGTQRKIVAAFRALMPPHSPSPASLTFIDGSRMGYGLLHHRLQYPHGTIAPFSFLWRPLPSTPTTPTTDSNTKASNEEDVLRQLWLWVHPAAYDEALEELLALANEFQLEVESRKGELNRFELIGPKSQAVLAMVLRVANDSSSLRHELWQRMIAADLKNAAALPADCVLALKVLDPRGVWPPKRYFKQSPADRPSESSPKLRLPDLWSAQFAESAIWEAETRSGKSIEPQHSVDLKRAAGDDLMMTSSSAPIFSSVDVLLVQRPGRDRTRGSGWTLIVPAGWGVPFWRSLVFAGGRAIGLRDFNKIQAEMEIASFPYDFPDTKAYQKHAELVAKRAKQKYDLRPPSKRVNFEKNGIRSPFGPDWKSLVNSADGILHVVRDAERLLLLSRGAPQHQSSKESKEEEKKKRKEGGNGGEGESRTEPARPLPLLSGSQLVCVIIRMVYGGTPTPHAQIYRFSATDAALFKRLKDKCSIDFDPKNIVMDRELIGYLTTSELGYGVGMGHGIGFCSVRGLALLSKHARQNLIPEDLVLVRNVTSKHYHIARLSVYVHI